MVQTPILACQSSSSGPDGTFGSVEVILQSWDE